MNRPSGILGQFITERAQILEKQEKMAESKKPNSVSGAKGLSALGSLMPTNSSMSLSEIIDKRPGKKEVEKYFKARCDELLE